MKTLVRILHIVALTVLIGSAGYAYSIKYETLYYAETLAKTKGKLQREREQIAVAKAEWALLTRPDRLQTMVDKHLDLQPMTISQLGRLADIPTRPAKDDEISRKLEALGFETGSIGKAGERPGDRPKAARSSDEIGRKLQSLGLDPSAARPAAHKQTDGKVGAKPVLKPAQAPAAKPGQDRKAEAKPASGPAHAAKLAQAKGAPKAPAPTALAR